MSSASIPSDIEFFAAAFDARRQETLPLSRSDRRRQLRRVYPTIQAIALYRDGELPRREDFREVACNDLSTSGIAFYTDEAPTYDRLIVALASPSEVLYLTAAVIRTTQYGRRGEFDAYLVGCRFMGRVQIS